MPLLPEIPNPHLEALGGGLSDGLVFCTSKLLSYITPIDSFALAVLFALETASSSISLLGGTTGCLLNKAPFFREWISKIGVSIFTVLGLDTLRNTIMITYS